MVKRKETFFDGIKFDIAKSRKLLDEFQRETPRAAAILGCAYLDNLLNDLLKKRLVKDEPLFKNVIDNLTFERRVILSYLIGAISKGEKEDLIAINNIRNDFAHDINLNNFNKNNIPAKCNSLLIIKSIQKKDKNLSTSSARWKYTISFATNILRLQSRILECKRIEKVKKPWQ